MRVPLKPLLMAGALLATPLLGACHHHWESDGRTTKVQFSIKNGSLTIRKHIVIITVSGREPAFVTTHGHLVIGKTDADEVPTNEDQKTALAAYNKAANTMIDKGIEVGVEGAHFAADAIGTVIKDAVDGKTKDIEKDVKKGAEPLKSKAYELCDQLDSWRQAQNEVAKLIPAFEPYAIITDADITKCHDEGFKDTEDDSADDDDKAADKDSDDDDDDKPSSPGAAVHESIHDSLSKSFQNSVKKSDDSSPDAQAQPPSAPASVSAAPLAPAGPKAPFTPISPPEKGHSGGSTKRPLTV
jgi:hypothetical protein